MIWRTMTLLIGDDGNNGEAQIVDDEDELFV